MSCTYLAFHELEIVFVIITVIIVIISISVISVISIIIILSIIIIISTTISIRGRVQEQYRINRVMEGHGKGVPLRGDFLPVVAGQQGPQHCVMRVQGPLHHLTVPASHGSSASEHWLRQLPMLNETMITWLLQRCVTQASAVCSMHLPLKPAFGLLLLCAS